MSDDGRTTAVREGGRTAPVLDEDAVAEDVQRLARELLPTTRELADTVTGWILAALPEVAPSGDDGALAGVRESTEQNIGAILSMLAFGAVPGGIEPPPGTLKVVRQTVAGGGDLATMLRAFRLGHAYVSRLWLAHVGARVDDADRLAAVVAFSSERLFTYFDGACERLAERYRRDFPATAGPGRASRREVVDALLAGDPVDPETAAGSLDYDVAGHHVAVVADDRDGGDGPAAIARAAAAMGAERVLVLPGDPGAWSAWAGRRGPFAAEALAAAEDVATDGVRLGVGEPASGPDGFRRTHEQAATARRFGDPGVPGLVRFRRVELAALLCAEPDRATRLAAARLGALAARDGGTSRLRETLRAYLASGRSKSRTAARLHVHQKTVAYRLRRVEELLGGPVPEDASELEAALLIDATLAGR